MVFNQDVQDRCKVLAQFFGIEHCIYESFRFCQAVDSDDFDDMETLHHEGKQNQCLREIQTLSFLYGASNVYSHFLLISGNEMGYDLHQAKYQLLWLERGMDI